MLVIQLSRITTDIQVLIFPIMLLFQIYKNSPDFSQAAEILLVNILAREFLHIFK